MKMPRSRLRSTAYHIVDASLLPWIRSHGGAGGSASVAKPASINCLWVAT